MPIASSGFSREGTRAGPNVICPIGYEPTGTVKGSDPEGLTLAWESVRRLAYPRRMATSPSRIDLLELDIDLRLTDLWREAADISDWNLEVVAAFMRAAYGKGYCDALTEDSPGSLCHDHGYRIPGRRPAPSRAA